MPFTFPAPSSTPHRLAHVAMHRVAGAGARVGDVSGKPHEHTFGCPDLHVAIGLNSTFTYEQKLGQSTWYGRTNAEGDIKDNTAFNDDPCANKIDLNVDNKPTGPDSAMLQAYQDAYLAAFVKGAPDRIPAAKLPTPSDPAPTEEELPTEVAPTAEQLKTFAALLASMPVPPVAYDGSLPPGTPGGPPLPGKPPVLVMKPVASSPEELVRAIAKARAPGAGTPGGGTGTPGAAPAVEKDNTLLYAGAAAAAGIIALFLLG